MPTAKAFQATKENTSSYPHWSEPLVRVAIFLAVALAYFPALHGGFLWDDDGHICPEGLRSLHGLWRIWTELGATQQYYPVLHSAFWLEYHLWGTAVTGYHVVNLLLHAGSACLVVAIARRLSIPGAWLAGLIFALHPVCVESVAWISEQKNTLSTIFCLGSALAYLRFNEDRRTSRYRLAFALFVLALLTKTVTAVLPAALLVLVWRQNGRLERKRDVMPLVPWLVLGAYCGLFTAWVERWVIGAHGTEFTLSFVQRCLLSGRAVWFYLEKLAWPTELSFIYPRWTIDPSAWWQYLFLAGLIVLALALWFCFRKNRGPLAALLIYVGTLFPVLGFLNIYPFAFSYVADHFQYLACSAVIVPTAAGFTWCAAQIPNSVQKWATPLTAIVLLSTLGTLTWQQANLYRDAETLYTATLERNPDCWLAHNNLGNILVQSPDRIQEAVAHFEAALKIKPDLADAHFNLANTFFHTPGRRREAIAHYEAALGTKPDYAEAHNNFGSLLAQDTKQLPEAIAHFEAALRIQPAFAAAHSNLGTAWSRLPGHLADAIAHYQAALRLDPNSAQTYFDLANAFAKIPTKQGEAVTAYETALGLNPDFAEAHYNLATVLSKTPEKHADAIAHYEQALRLRPDWDFVRQILEQEPVPSPK